MALPKYALMVMAVWCVAMVVNGLDKWDEAHATFYGDMHGDETMREFHLLSYLACF